MILLIKNQSETKVKELRKYNDQKRHSHYWLNSSFFFFLTRQETQMQTPGYPKRVESNTFLMRCHSFHETYSSRISSPFLWKDPGSLCDPDFTSLSSFLLSNLGWVKQGMEKRIPKWIFPVVFWNLNHICSLIWPLISCLHEKYQSVWWCHWRLTWLLWCIRFGDQTSQLQPTVDF